MRSYGSNALHPDAWILRLNANGGVLWPKTYGGAGLDYATSVRPSNVGGFVVDGDSVSFGVGGIWLLDLAAIGAAIGATGGRPPEKRAGSMSITEVQCAQRSNF
jgi:hypothetical protein